MVAAGPGPRLFWGPSDLVGGCQDFGGHSVSADLGPLYLEGCLRTHIRVIPVLPCFIQEV